MPPIKPPLLLDVTRSLRRQRHAQASGIDRVERAYLDWALTRGNLRLLARLGRRHYLVPERRAAGFAQALFARRSDLDVIARLAPWRDLQMRRAEACLRAHAEEVIAGGHHAVAQALGPRTAYLNVGHCNLDAGGRAGSGLGAYGARGGAALVMIHDTIPLDRPELCRPETPARFEAMLGAAAGACRLICNSADTRRRVLAALGDRGLARPDAEVLALGIDPAPPPGPALTPGAPPYFVTVGTIEPRKNHALLLAIWAGFWQQVPRDRIPHLYILGRRGWAGAEFFTLLDRHPMMGRVVHELNDADDARRDGLLAHARALLMPSLDEGYGLPLGEALAAGVPAIASDLPALRALGGELPHWCDPGDREAWRQAILSHAAGPGPASERARRRAAWPRPRWETHFAGLEAMLGAMLAERRVS